jgi:hypothetical protein
VAVVAAAMILVDLLGNSNDMEKNATVLFQTMLKKINKTIKWLAPLLLNL